MDDQSRHASMQSAPTGMHVLPTGAQILTLEGTLPVEYLSPGDRIITRDSGMAVLRAVRLRKDRVNCLRLSPGALAPRAPRSDILLPVQTMIYQRHPARAGIVPCGVVAAGRLLDGVKVRYAGRPRISLMELIFDAPHILYVEGLELAPLSAAERQTEARPRLRASLPR